MKPPHLSLALQDLVEKVVVLRNAVEQTQGSSPVVVGTLLAEKMSQYASLLASQGSLLTAIAYLPENSDQVSSVLIYSLQCESWCICAAAVRVMVYLCCCSVTHSVSVLLQCESWCVCAAAV